MRRQSVLEREFNFDTFCLCYFDSRTIYIDILLVFYTWLRIDIRFQQRRKKNKHNFPIFFMEKMFAWWDANYVEKKRNIYNGVNGTFLYQVYSTSIAAIAVHKRVCVVDFWVPVCWLPIDVNIVIETNILTIGFMIFTNISNSDHFRLHRFHWEARF